MNKKRIRKIVVWVERHQIASNSDKYLLARIWTHVEYTSIVCHYCEKEIRDICKHIVTECGTLSKQRNHVYEDLGLYYHQALINECSKDSEALTQLMLGSSVSK